ncbi:MAG: GAF domain-containing protein [Fimbriimonadaceae bacterium]|nr:GAF domain-containing protein [Fimbriimonadaceae bacterium]QYK58739.1 MAG: GAF domain-containing protein [Fimbriimonadaceae bacterium]
MGKATSKMKSEAARLAVLRQLNPKDTKEDWPFDALTALAAQMFGTPIAALSFIDSDRQWFKSILGSNIKETSRDVAFCNRTIEQQDVYVVTDATRDEEFADNPLVTGSHSVRFYAGAPIWIEGHNVGALCVMDRRKKEISDDQRSCLLIVASIAARLLMLERDLQESNQKVAQLERSKAA